MPPKKRKWINQFADGISRFLQAVAEARIPPSKTQVVPNQGVLNLATGTFGIALYTAAGFVNAGGRASGIATQFVMAAIGAALLFVAAVVVIVSSRANLVENWNKVASVFVVMWLLALVVFLLATYPLLLITGNYILLDKISYPITDFFISDPRDWQYDLTKSLLCSFGAGLILITRTKISDPKFRLTAVQPWIWLLVMTLIVGGVFHTSLYRLSTL